MKRTSWLRKVKSAHRRPYFRVHMVSESVWVLLCCASFSVVDLKPKQICEGSSGSYFPSYCLETSVHIDILSFCVIFSPPPPCNFTRKRFAFFWYYVIASELYYRKCAKQIKLAYIEFIYGDYNELIETLIYLSS